MGWVSETVAAAAEVWGVGAELWEGGGGFVEVMLCDGIGLDIGFGA